MTDAQPAYRRPAGPDQVVASGIDVEALLRLTARQREFGDMVSMTEPNGRPGYLARFILPRTERCGKHLTRFDPDRFLASDKADKNRPYSCFSLGPRRCLGGNFSLLEFKVHLGLLLTRSRLRLLDKEDPGVELGFNLRSSTGIFLQPEER